MSSALRLLAVLFVSCSLASADTIREALVNLCDPAKIGTNTENQDAILRVLQICYWLEMARRDGCDPANEMREVMVTVGWGGNAKGKLTAEAIIENWRDASRYGCLDEEGMLDIRQGNSPTIRIGRDAGDKLGVYELIPRSLSPELDTTLANLRLVPMQSYHFRFNQMGKRLVYWAKEFYAAGLLSDEGALHLLPALETAVHAERKRKGKCGTNGMMASAYLNSIKEELRRRGAL
jgi:hypothetical protein